MFATIRFLDANIELSNADAARKRKLLLKRDAKVQFDKGNYGSHQYTAVEITAHTSSPSADDWCACGPKDHNTFFCRSIRKAPGGAAVTFDPLFFVTTCEISDRNVSCFLNQFDAVVGYFKAQQGFLGFRLFESCYGDARFRFINVARWRSASDFVRAFSTDEFKSLIAGGFDHDSQIIVARETSTVQERGAA